MNSITHFVTYIFAMLGFILVALYIYKIAVSNPYNMKNKNYMQVENMLRLSPAKSLYIIKTGNERFLIAADASTTTMLAKLDENNPPPEYTEPDETVQGNILQEFLKKISRG
ncbi:flagellar biosynthetic protein FliO [bacterium]|nr:flagellar biosynthetic protein FliO [bacterium]